MLAITPPLFNGFPFGSTWTYDGHSDAGLPFASFSACLLGVDFATLLTWAFFRIVSSSIFFASTFNSSRNLTFAFFGPLDFFGFSWGGTFSEVCTISSSETGISLEAAHLAAFCTFSVTFERADFAFTFPGIWAFTFLADGGGSLSTDDSGAEGWSVSDSSEGGADDAVTVSGLLSLE